MSIIRGWSFNTLGKSDILHLIILSIHILSHLQSGSHFFIRVWTMNSILNFNDHYVKFLMHSSWQRIHALKLSTECIGFAIMFTPIRKSTWGFLWPHYTRTVEKKIFSLYFLKSSIKLNIWLLFCLSDHRLHLYMELQWEEVHHLWCPWNFQLSQRKLCVFFVCLLICSLICMFGFSLHSNSPVISFVDSFI